MPRVKKASAPINGSKNLEEDAAASNLELGATLQLNGETPLVGARTARGKKNGSVHKEVKSKSKRRDNESHENQNTLIESDLQERNVISTRSKRAASMKPDINGIKESKVSAKIGARPKKAEKKKAAVSGTSQIKLAERGGETDIIPDKSSETLLGGQNDGDKSNQLTNGPSKKRAIKNKVDTERSRDIHLDTSPQDTKRKKSTKKVQHSKLGEHVAETEQSSKVDSVDAKSKLKRGRKRAPSGNADDSEPAPSKKVALINSVSTTYNKADFALSSNDGTDVESYNLKISSWNVAGLRSWLKKDGLKFLQYEEPDIFCMQEIKCTPDQLPEEAVRIPGYHPYWLCMPGGYAGVGIYSKIMPINVEYGIGNSEFDSAGRIITAEYEKFFLVNVYVPNSGRKLVNLELRMRWEILFQKFVCKLDARKPVIICGDMNVSHKEIDLANPKSNMRNAGFTKEERDKMSDLLALGYVDTFRFLYPDRTGSYTFWSYMGNARSRNVGWRLDYFITSERLVKRIVDNCIRAQCMGSDHCPITLFLKL